MFPVYLDFECQHALLTSVQQILEESLFQFGTRAIQNTVKDKGWDCAQCVELNDWTKLIRKNKGLLPESKVKGLAKPLRSVLDSVAQIRHTAVHRQRVTTSRIMTFLEDAESLVELVQDSSRLQQITEIRQDAFRATERLVQSKKRTEERLMQIHNDSAAEEMALRRREHLLVHKTMKEHDDSVAHAMMDLQEAITEGQSCGICRLCDCYARCYV
ncbi:hypothetical protein MRB53_038336 [Persea americana]|nr:hypothetical protein MRB53_038336 [Persea americana]